jgi:hypothetical protein
LTHFVCHLQRIPQLFLCSTTPHIQSYILPTCKMQSSFGPHWDIPRTSSVHQRSPQLTQIKKPEAWHGQVQFYEPTNIRRHRKKFTVARATWPPRSVHLWCKSPASLFSRGNAARKGRHLPVRLIQWSNPIFLPTAYSPALIYFGRERGWWVTCNYPKVLKEKNRKITTCAICWPKSVLHEEKRRDQKNHNVERGPT